MIVTDTEGSNKICFLIDDDTDDQEIFSLALKEVSEDYTCEVSSDGYEALHHLIHARQLPDYIFLDLNMPRMNGKECLAELKKVDRLRQIPVVIYSTSSFQHDINETRALGAAAFITKPFSVDELTRTLHHFFTHQSLHFPARV
jgi:CheY-like chemotaxis protein